MNQEHFAYLELSDGPGPTQQFSVPEIPDRQYLNYLDLVAMQPNATLLKRVSRRLIEKYQFIPIVLTVAETPPRLPGHLDPQFHLRWKTQTATQICYVAMVPPQQELILKMVSNAIGNSLYILPIQTETFSRFMQEKYARLF